MMAPAQTEPGPQLRRRYEATLRRAVMTTFSGSPDAAWRRLFALNAAFYLGYWLEPDAHAALLEPLLGDAHGLAGVPLPADPYLALVAAQHAGEVAALLGDGGWSQAYSAILDAQDRSLLDEAVLAAARRIMAAPGSSAAIHAALAAHARRRLRQLALAPAAVEVRLTPGTASRMRDLAARAAAPGHAHMAQLAEALLTEREELCGHPDADLALDALAACLAESRPLPECAQEAGHAT